MNPAILVPDTGILVARGFGDKVDPNARAAIGALSLAISQGTTILVPQSVGRELDRLLDSVEAVYTTLQEAMHSVVSREPPISGLRGAEEILLEVKARSKGLGRRFLGAIETETARIVTLNPSLPLERVFAVVTATALLWKEGIRERARPPSVEFLDWPSADASPFDPPISEVTGMDVAHLRGCEEIGVRFDCPIVFLVLERPLHQHKHEIQARLPHVSVTTPSYIGAYIG